MRKLIWIPIVIIAVGIVALLVGFANGGLKSLSIDRGGVHVEGSGSGNLITVDETYPGYKSIDIEADYFDHITLKEGDSFSVHGQNYESYGGLNVKLDGDTLKVDAKRHGKWLNFGIDKLMGNTANDSWLEITWPKDTSLDSVQLNIGVSRINAADIDCKELSIEDAFGNIDVSTVKCGSLTLKAASGKVGLNGADVSGNAVVNDSFGDVTLSGVTADTLNAELSSGKLSAGNVSAATLTVSNNFGKIDVNNAEADSMTLKLNSGDLSATGVKAGGLTVNSDFGKVSIDRLDFTGLCTIKNNSGDVTLGLLVDENSLSYDLNADAGSVWVDNMKSDKSVTSRVPGALANLSVHADFGSIHVNFPA